CIRICRLEKLKVIVNNEIQPNAWRSFIGQSFPTIALEHLTPLFMECSPKYKLYSYICGKGLQSANPALRSWLIQLRQFFLQPFTTHSKFDDSISTPHAAQSEVGQVS
ncbi:unnamed protein product, partial [Allacma fusca]